MIIGFREPACHRDVDSSVPIEIRRNNWRIQPPTHWIGLRGSKTPSPVVHEDLHPVDLRASKSTAGNQVGLTVAVQVHRYNRVSVGHGEGQTGRDGDGHLK